MDPKALVEISGEEKRLPEMEEVLKNVSSRCRIMLPDIASAEAWQFLSQYSLENPKVTTGPDHLAYVIFTSGSSGKPKGVMGRHGPLTHFLPWLSETFAISDNDRFSFLSSISTNKLQREIFTALSLGATLCIPSADDIGSFGKLDEWLRIREISVIHLTPAMAQLLDDTARKSVPSVRRVFFGGDLLQMRDVDRAKKLMPRAEIVNFYNSSETQRGGGYALFSKQRMENEKHVPPLGRGIQDVQLLILNQTRKTAGIGELGEICIRSPHMARGYLGDEALTKERFIKNPYTGIEGDRIYRVGEFGRYLPDGTVEFVARGENQVSIRGFRVDLGEIESVLKSHANVLNAVVSLHENRADCLVAHLVSDRGSILSIDEIRRFLRARLPSYMIPGAFIICDSLPLTPTGKVDRRALMAVDLDKIDQEIIFVAPRSSAEELVAKIWATVLKLNRIGINNNFFDLGGHSLLAIQIVSQIRELFDIDLPLRVVFESPTVAEMAAVITEYQGKAFAKEELSRVLDELELMSDEEAQGLVAEQMVIKG
jgi:amino acid adenylation domain-containing protein